MKLCTTIIPTIGRSTLERAVESALRQDIAPELHDIIVVNDSGKPLGCVDIMRQSRVTVVNTNRCERSVARNVGAAMAHSKYLHFLDDDDYLLPGGLMALIDVAESTEAVWVYGAMHCVDREDQLVFENQPDVYGNLFSHFVVGETISLIPSIVNREALFQVGGFETRVIPSEDRDLACRLALIGNFAYTEKFVATARIGDEGGSWENGNIKEVNRLIRERALDLPGALSRMRDSVKVELHLRGRGCRAYLFSSMINALDGHICLATKRLVFSLLLASYYPLFPDFWRGLFYSHDKQHSSGSS